MPPLKVRVAKKWVVNLTCNNCGSKSHPGLDAGECPFDEVLLKSLDYNKVISMIAKTEFETNNPKRFALEWISFQTCPIIRKIVNERNQISQVRKYWWYGIWRITKMVLSYGSWGRDDDDEEGIAQTKRRKAKQTHLVKLVWLLISLQYRVWWIRPCFWHEGFNADELQKKLGAMCGYVHGDGKKCGGRFVSRINK